MFVDIRSTDEKVSDRIFNYLLNKGLEIKRANVPNVLTIMHLRPIDTHSAFEHDRFIFLVELDDSVSKEEKARLKEEGNQVICYPKGQLGPEQLDRVVEIVLQHCDKDD